MLRSAEPLDLSDVSALLCAQIVCLMTDNYSELMRVPQRLKSDVSERLEVLAANKVRTRNVLYYSTYVHLHNTFVSTFTVLPFENALYRLLKIFVCNN